MKIAVVGKGGSGKTTIAGTLARVLAKRNQSIVAIDGDPNPNLALSLGVSRDSADAIRAIPASVVETVPAEHGPSTLRLSMPREALLSEFGAKAPDGIRLIVMGKPPDGSAGSGCMCASHRAVRGLIAELTDCGDHTITDMEAGLEHLKRGTARNVEAMLVVVEPYYRSLEAGSRTFSLARELRIPHLYAIANKVHDQPERDAITAYCREHSMPIIGEVPFEQAFGEAELRGQSPFEHAPGSGGVRAIEGIADRLAALDRSPVAA